VLGSEDQGQGCFHEGIAALPPRSELRKGDIQRLSDHRVEQLDGKEGQRKREGKTARATDLRGSQI